MRAGVWFAAVLAASIAFVGVVPASATTITVKGYYTVSYAAIAGNNPTITYDLNHTSSTPFVETLTLGALPTTPVNFFTINPAGTCGATCVGDTEGSHHYFTASGTYTVNFYFTNLIVSNGPITDTGLYQAKYGGTPLTPCALNSGAGDSDCLTWSHHAVSQSGGSDTLAVNFTQGSGSSAITGVLDIILGDAEDWSIKPTISFEASTCGAGIICGKQGGDTPLPAALPMFAGGLGVIGLLARRRKRKAS